MSTAGASRLQAAVQAHWARLGPWSSLRPLALTHAVSNDLFRSRAGESDYLVKVVQGPAALAGSTDEAAVARLESVATATDALGRAGLPVEAPQRSDTGAFVHRVDGAALRVHAFVEGRPFDGSDADIASAAAAQALLHERGAAALGPETASSLAQLATPYALRETAPLAAELRAWAVEHSDSQLASVAAQWSTVEWALERVRLDFDDAPRFVHTDLHPKNILWRAQSLVMLDFDNARMGDARHCLAFSVLRFAFATQPRSPLRLAHVARIFAAELDSNLREAMVHVELEKTLRIMRRVQTTGQYQAFLGNLAPLHLANLALLREMESTA